MGDQGQKGQQRHVDRPLQVGVDAAPEHVLGTLGELVELALLLGERLDDVDADDVLLGDRGDVGHALLNVAQHRVRDGRVAVGEHDDERRDRGRGNCKSGLCNEHHDADAHDRDHVLEEEDQPVPEKKRTDCRSTVARDINWPVWCRS